MRRIRRIFILCSIMVPVCRLKEFLDIIVHIHIVPENASERPKSRHAEILRIMNHSIEKYAEDLSRRRPIRRRHKIVPAGVAARLKKVEQSGAVLWDVYGTLLAVTAGDLERTLEKKETMHKAFRRTAKEFGFNKYLDADPAEILLEWYVREIEKTHRRKRARGVFSPEVKIQHIWLRICR